MAFDRSYSHSYYFKVFMTGAGNGVAPLLCPQVIPFMTPVFINNYFLARVFLMVLLFINGLAQKATLNTISKGRYM
mgnify:CR=1 FL=1